MINCAESSALEEGKLERLVVVALNIVSCAVVQSTYRISTRGEVRVGRNDNNLITFTRECSNVINK